MTKITITAEDEKTELRLVKLERRVNALDCLEEEITNQDKDVEKLRERIDNLEMHALPTDEFTDEVEADIQFLKTAVESHDRSLNIFAESITKHRTEIHDLVESVKWLARIVGEKNGNTTSEQENKSDDDGVPILRKRHKGGDSAWKGTGQEN